MTISYGGNFALLLFNWKGGVVKSIFRELVVFLFLFYVVRMILQFAPNSVESKQNATKTVELFFAFTKAVPLAFFIGFFVTLVVARWQLIVNNIPWPDDIMLLVNAHVPSGVKDDKLKRHAIARYLALCQIFVFRDLSTKVRTRFPRMIEVANAGLMTLDEYQMYQEARCTNVRWQLPLQWAINGILVPMSGKAAGCIPPQALIQIINEINKFRNSLYKLHMYNWICIPLAYAQAVSAVVYAYFGLCLVGHQYLGKPADPVVPFLTIVQFVFYVGWLKVGQQLMRPFGEDDDDLEMNFFLDRHAMVSMYLADNVCDKLPEINNEDKLAFDKDGTVDLPYTKLSTLKAQNHPPKSHAFIQLKNRHGLELWEKKTAIAPIIQATLDCPLLKEAKRTSMYF